MYFHGLLQKIAAQVAPVQTPYDSSSPSGNWNGIESFVTLNCFHLWHVIVHAGTPCAAHFSSPGIRVACSQISFQSLLKGQFLREAFLTSPSPALDLK